MITAAPWRAWPGFEAFFVSRVIDDGPLQTHGGPDHLIQVDRRELARRLRTETLTRVITGEDQ